MKARHRQFWILDANRNIFGRRRNEMDYDSTPCSWWLAVLYQFLPLRSSLSRPPYDGREKRGISVGFWYSSFRFPVCGHLAVQVLETTLAARPRSSPDSNRYRRSSLVCRNHVLPQGLEERKSSNNSMKLIFVMLRSIKTAYTWR